MKVEGKEIEPEVEVEGAEGEVGVEGVATRTTLLARAMRWETSRGQAAAAAVVRGSARRGRRRAVATLALPPGPFEHGRDRNNLIFA